MLFFDEKKPSKWLTILGIIIAVPIGLFLFYFSQNEYVFAQWGRYVALGLGLALGLAYLLVRKKSAHVFAWILATLSLYNFPVSIGGFVYLHYWALLLAVILILLPVFVFRRRTLTWRILTGVTLYTLVGFVLLMISRNYYFLDEKARCAGESRKLPSFVQNVAPQPLHPYDFGGESGSRIIGVAYGMQKDAYLFDLDRLRLIKGSRIDTGAQRITPVPDKPMLAAPAWGHWGELSRKTNQPPRDPIYFIEAQTGRPTGLAQVPKCRNIFEVEFAADRMYALCEVSHSFHEMSAEPPYQALRSLTLPGMDSYDFALDRSRGKAYITDWFSPALLEVDLAGMKVSRWKWIGWSSFGVAFGPDGYLYVAQPFSRRVRVIDTGKSEMRIVRTIQAGYGPRDLEFDSGRQTLFIGNYFDGTVDLVRLGDGRRLLRIYVGDLVRGLWFDAPTNRLLAATACGIKMVELSRAQVVE